MRWATFVDTKATEKQKLNTTKRGWWDTSYAIPGSLCRWWPNTARLSGETLMCVCVCDVITSEVRCPPSHPSVFSWPHWMQFPEHHALPPFEKILIKTWSPNGGLNDVKLKPEQEMPGVKVFPKQGLYFTSTLTTLGARKIETIFFFCLFKICTLCMLTMLGFCFETETHKEKLPDFHHSFRYISAGTGNCDF